ncbi:hypothetical protein [Trueperella pyogenes]|uniref:hypothetical protein n=1 Tax=Trueperella pyogenes TaxID=1661 RepID=UPI00345D6253
MIGLVGLDRLPFDRLGIDTQVFSEAHFDAPGHGMAFDIDADATLRHSCDALDGMASRVGAVDTIAFQPMGSARMVVGFAALPGALGRSMDARLGKHCGQRGLTGVVVGAGAAAACAIAALVQHRFQRIIIASATPGLALRAAHRMGVDVEAKRLSGLNDIDIDLLVQTTDELPGLSPQAVVDPAGIWEGFTGPLVSAREITARQRQDQIRVLTGKNIELDRILAAL